MSGRGKRVHGRKYFRGEEGESGDAAVEFGCLEGVTRGVLMEIAADAGTSVTEQTLRMEDLYARMRSSSHRPNRNVIGVREIAGRADGKRGKSEITRS